MNTYFKIKIWGSSDEMLNKAMDEAFREVDRIDSLTSAFSPSSALWILNTKGEVVSPDLAELATRALEISRESGGTFDPTVLGLMNLWGFRDSTHSSYRIPSKEEIDSALSYVDYRKIAVSDDTVRLRPVGEEALRINRGSKGLLWGVDLSAIAEGYAVDRVIRILKENGVSRGIVDAGGDIGCFGERKGGWSIGIRNPRGEGLLAIVHVKEGGIGTSGDYENFFEKDGQRYHHLMNPATGYPARGAVSATIIAPTATEADAWAKPLFVMGEKGISFLDSMGGIQGMLVMDDGRILTTKGFPKLEKP